MGLLSWLSSLKKTQKPKLIELKNTPEEETSFQSLEKYTSERPNKEICNAKGCRKKLNLANMHDCKHCGRYHCEKHRLPEDHGCENPRLPKGMRSSGSKTQRHL